MPLRFHLQELRACLLRATLVFTALFVVGVVFNESLIRFFCIPWSQTRADVVAAGFPDPGPLTIVSPAEAFTFGLKAALAAALLVGAPYYLWEVWRFVSAGLLAKEKRAVLMAFPPAVLLLLGGLGFGFQLMMPYALYFFVTYLPPDLAEVGVRMSDYLSLVINMSLLMGGVFQLPLAMWLVARAGLVSVATLSKSRRISTLLILVFAAVVTPPDVVTMIFVALPMLLLFEIGLLLARRAEKARLA